MQDVRRKKPIKYNKDGSVSLDGSGVKILRLLEPQGEPDVIECDGMRYVPERTCNRVLMDITGNKPYRKVAVSLNDTCNGCSECGAPWRTHGFDHPNYCPNCGTKVVSDEKDMW